MSPHRGLPIGSILVSLVLLAGAAIADAQDIPNPDFTEGTDQPAGWTLSGGQGRWVDHQLLEVTGTGKDSNRWNCDVAFTPGGLYRFQMRARRTSGSGAVVCGPNFANHDYGGVGQDWRSYSFVFRVPDGLSHDTLHLGQWEATGTMQFDSVRLQPVLPIHSRAGKLLLGDGESIRDGRYEFVGSFEREGTNYHRTLVSSTVGFNTNRWCFGANSQVTYRFEVPGHRFLSGEASFVVNYHTAGVCTAEVSRDGNQWQPLATKEGTGTGKGSLPADLFPADRIFLRLRSSNNANFQVDHLEFTAPLSDPPDNASGRTLFADQKGTCPALKIEQLSLAESVASGQAAVQMAVRNGKDQATSVTLAPSVQAPDGTAVNLPAQKADLPAGQTATLTVALPNDKPGEHRATLSLQPSAGEPLETSFTFRVPDYYRADYGRRLSAAGSSPSVWWCDATHKVSRQRPAPTETGQAAELSAARNDHEAVQVVVRPDRPLKALRAACSPLKRSGANDTISPEHVKILRVYYHFVEHPTDGSSVRDWWPDALPPLTEPIDVEAGSNQPLWVLVNVPKDAAAGDYAGQLSLEAEGWSADVPIRLHVWDFALPERNHLETAFGFDPGLAFQYHQVKSEEDKRKLLDLYFQSFAEHRISTYNLTPMDPIRVKFVADANPPRAEIDFSAFDRAMAQAVERYHFTNFSLPIQGMGGGTFHERWNPSIDKFGEDTPEYKAMFSSQVKQLEEHLRQKGWLDMAYVYWFDEPDPKDYDFVRGGMERIKRYAPGIQTMLTEEPNQALAGAIDIWCPLTPAYDHDGAEKLRARGNRFWWYVCCGPKAPFCTLFIDHPAAELRVWHWQTWQRKVVGTLVWQSNYWTSSAAYPDQPQNPYADPMGYVSGYSTPAGTKQFWGNGDGRFIYPPLAAAVPGASGSDPVLEPPVSSIRWEMLREGVEDYEYLYLLGDLLKANRAKLPADAVKRYDALLEVPASITTDLTTFTTDPSPIYERRAAIAAAIEALSR
jgi:hypothetical protein